MRLLFATVAEEGSIDESNEKAVIYVLTKEQKAYLDEQSTQLEAWYG